MSGQFPPSDVEFGCAYCADETNFHYGHVAQVGSDEARRMILLRCPRCRTLYENTPGGEDTIRRLTEHEAEALFPGHA